ncbi:MAG: glycosyltransferase family 2 protein [Bacteroidaceae bacterium]|nr:glycosyltransferase family 2 protein [Bacteroidaceae bacterium]
MITVIVPCYNEEKALPFFFEEINKVRANMATEEFELLFVDDGSSDSTRRVIMDFAAKDKAVRYVIFSRNFGKEAAIYAGLEHSRGDYVAIMDADLQDPPSLLPVMYEALVNEGYDSVATRRVDRKGEPPIRSFFARQFYKIMNKISNTDLVDGARDYRLMNRQFVDALLSMGEYNRFSKGLFGWVGFRTKWLEFENVERVAGETKWSFWKLLLYAIDGVVAFSTAPLQLSGVLGIFMAFLSFLAMIFLIIRRLMFGDPVAGWASIVVIIVFLNGMNMFFVGVMGQYLSKTYLEVKNRPIYIVRESNTKEEK